MTDIEDVLKSTIEQQERHIEILRDQNELLRSQLNRRWLPGLTGTFRFRHKHEQSVTSYKKSVLDSNWFYFLHGAMMGVFIHVYVNNYEIIRDFYYP